MDLKNKSKGFSFSFDGMLAAFILIMMFMFISTTQMNGIEFSSQKIVQKQLSDDLLDSMIDLGKAQTLNSGQIDGFIQANIPTNYDYQLEITKYFLSTAGKYDQNQLILFGNQTTDLNTTSYVESKKIFLVFSGNDINSYNSVKLRVWVR